MDTAITLALFYLAIGAVIWMLAIDTLRGEGPIDADGRLVLAVISAAIVTLWLLIAIVVVLTGFAGNRRLRRAGESA
jgi:hypothetical protein